MIDGETHRGKLMARETQEILKTYLGTVPEPEFDYQKAPELVLDKQEQPTKYSDIWSTASSIMEFLLHQRTWDFDHGHPIFVRQSMSVKVKPPIVNVLKNNANSQLHFLAQAFNYGWDQLQIYLDRGAGKAILFFLFCRTL